MIAPPSPGPCRRIPRTLVRAGLAAVAVAALSSCAAGRLAQTAQQTGVVDGTQASVGNIALRGVTVSAPAQHSWAKGSDAPLDLLIVNTGQQSDTLTSVTTSAAGSVLITAGTSGSASAAGSSAPSGAGSSTPSGAGSSASVALPGLSSVSVGVQGGGSGARIVLTGLTAELFPAQTVTVTFAFATAGSVTFPVSVHLADPPSNRPSVDVAATAEA